MHSETWRVLVPPWRGTGWANGPTEGRTARPANARQKSGKAQDSAPSKCSAEVDESLLLGPERVGEQIGESCERSGVGYVDQ
jgi:hypothetical protein